MGQLRDRMALSWTFLSSTLPTAVSSSEFKDVPLRIIPFFAYEAARQDFLYSRSIKSRKKNITLKLKFKYIAKKQKKRKRKDGGY